MSDLFSSESPQIKLINEWYRGLKEKNLDLIAKPLHKDHVRITHPKSLGKPVQTKEEWLQEFAASLSFMTDFETIIHSTVEVPGKVIVHATNKVKNSTGVDITGESIYISHFATDEDGKLKIKEHEEFVDSKAYSDLIQAMTAKGAN